MIADIDKRKVRKVVGKICTERRKIALLKDVKIGKRFEEEVIELVDVEAPHLWGHFKDGVLEACDEVCGKKKGRKIIGDAWWWNVDVKETVSRNKEPQNTMC